MFKKPRHSRPVKSIHHRRGSARVFGIPVPLLVVIALASLALITYLVTSIYNGIIERANALVATGVHPDVSAALTAMFMEHVGVWLMYLAAFMFLVGIAVDRVRRELKGR